VTYPEDGEPAFEQFVDPLTGRPLPAPEPPAEPAPDQPSPAADPAERSGLRERPVLAALVAGTAVLILAFLAFETTPSDLPDPNDIVSAAGAGDPSTVPPPLPSLPSVSPSIAGWQPVSSIADGLTFDVPPDWTVEAPGAIVGFEAANGRLLAMHGVSQFESNFCPTLDVSARAQAGFTTIDADEATSVADAAAQTVISWSQAAYGSPDGVTPPAVTVSEAKTVRVLAGAVDAEEVTATVRPADPNDCSPPSVSITAVALPLSVDPSASAYHVHLLLADQQVTGAVTPDVAARIVTTIRRTS
jgi:hypothetical protein